MSSVTQHFKIIVIEIWIERRKKTTFFFCLVDKNIIIALYNPTNISSISI
jgi:hypothetical protein